MATINSARALGIDHLVGSLEVGKRPTSRSSISRKRTSTVPNRPIAALVFSAHGTDVDTVIVNGKVLLRGGELQGFGGEQEVLAEARRRSLEVIERAGIKHRVTELWRRT